MYKDDLTAAHCEIDSLKKRLGENKKSKVINTRSSISKTPKPKGYWWGRWYVYNCGREEWGELMFGVVIGPILLLVLLFIFNLTAVCQVNDKIQRAMCISIFKENNQKLISFTGKAHDEVLKCEFLSLSGQTRGSIVSERTINPTRYW